MSLVINSNIASLNTQNQLSKNTKTYNTALERLSSGLRINSAADDAAGLAISNGLEAQYNGLNQATNNANDGLSLLGTAESAMNAQVDLLQRMRELAVQSSSDTNSSADRADINNEVTQLKQEFERISNTTTFNGQNLLNGTFSDKNIQVGAYSGSNQKISIGLDSTSSAVVGKSDAIANATTMTGGAAQDSTAGTDAGILETGQMTINGVAIPTATIAANTDTTIIDAINAKKDDTGVVASLNSSNHIVLTAANGEDITVAFADGVDNSAANAASITGITAGTTRAGVTAKAANAGDITITVNGQTTKVGATSSDGLSTAEANSSALAFANAINGSTADTGVTATASTNYTGVAQTAGALAAGDLKINGVDVGAVTVSSATDTALEDAINNVSAATGVTATVNSTGQLTLSAVDGRNIEVKTTANGTTVSGLGVSAADTTYHGQVSLSSYSGNFTVGDAQNLLNFSGKATEGSDNVATIAVTTANGANAAIDTIDGALQQLNTSLAKIGAQTNRLDSVVSNLSSAAENVASSKSSIMDADFAQETSNMTKASILEQAAVSVLAQANQQPQLALTLLK
jgi:flagellin